LSTFICILLARSVPEEFTAGYAVGEISESKSLITYRQMRDVILCFVLCFIDCTTHMLPGFAHAYSVNFSVLRFHTMKSHLHSVRSVTSVHYLRNF